MDATTIIDRKAIVRVYSGRPGCACGCRGKWTSAPAQITRVVNVLNARRAELDEDNTSGVFSLTTETRMYVAYTAIAL